MCCHTFREYGDEGMTLLNSCQVIKSLALFGNDTTQFVSGDKELGLVWKADFGLKLAKS